MRGEKQNPLRCIKKKAVTVLEGTESEIAGEGSDLLAI